MPSGWTVFGPVCLMCCDADWETLGRGTARERRVLTRPRSERASADNPRSCGGAPFHVERRPLSRNRSGMALTTGDIRWRRGGVTALNGAHRKSAGTVYRGIWSGTECHNSAYSLPVPYAYITVRNLERSGILMIVSRGTAARVGSRLECSHDEAEPRLVCVRPSASAPLSDRVGPVLKAEAETTVVHSIE